MISGPRLSECQSNKAESAIPVQPVSSGERYLTLDALRGAALFGVLLVNDLDFFRVSLFEQLLAFHTHPGMTNHLVDVLAAVFLEFKAFTLFSFLFGVGIGVQTERVTARAGNASWFLARRFCVLLGIGLCHMFLISNVDILCLYAVCGLLLLPVLESPRALLATLGVAAIALTFILPFDSIFPSEKVIHEHAAIATRVYATGSFREMLEFRWHETWQFIAPLLLSALPKTAGLMLLGIAAWRYGIPQKPPQHRRLLMAVTLVGGSLGGVATCLAVFRESTGHPVTEILPPMVIEAISYIPLALAYASAFLLWWASRRAGSFIQSIAALGQMALTSYLVQSGVLSLIFYGYGLGLFGRLGSAPAALIGVIIYLAQIGFSRAWLQRFQFGPAEWVWRSLTYVERQPMRRSKAKADQGVFKARD